MDVTDRTDVCFAGVVRQVELLRAGRVSAVELVDAYLHRIAELDAGPGGLNAFREVFTEQARAEAAAADDRLAAGDDAPLLGVPIAVKEDQAIAGWPTTVGSQAVDTVAVADAETVRRLRSAGAVILGRTRAPELCLWPYTETEFAGPTRNPWSAAHSPGGSSGGSAAAVAAGLAAAGLGTDGGGSIRVPAASCGLVGVKPQRGRVSLAPQPQVWSGLSVAGPITRTVADAALLLDVLAGPVAGDADAAEPPVTSFAAAAAGECGRLRIAVSMRPWPVGGRVDGEVRQAVWATARALTGLGHRVVRRDPPLADRAALRSFSPRYLRSAADAAAAVDHPDRLSGKTRAVAAVGRLLSDGVLAAAGRASARVSARVTEIFDDVDVVLTPTLPRPALRIGELDRHNWLLTSLGAQRHVGFTSLWNLVGNPAFSVPAGFSAAGLPLAVQLVGRAHDECTLFGLAAQLERARPWADRRPPERG